MPSDCLQDIAFGRDHHRNVVPQKGTQFILNGQILRVAGGYRQHLVFKGQRHHAIQLSHGLADSLDYRLVELGVLQRYRLHPHLLGQRLNQLLVGNQLHVFGDPAQQGARLLFLLFEHDLKLLVG